MNRSKREKLSLFLTSVFAACAVIVTGLVIRQEVFEPQGLPNGVTSSHLTDEAWQRALGKRADSRGAPVKLVNFYDYQCPYCAQLEPVLKRVVKRYPDKVEIIRRHLPLSIHPQAYPAALAAECARRQNAFLKYHILLFKNQKDLSAAVFDSLAAGLEAIERKKTFHRCLAERKTAQQVDSDMKVASALDLDSTPTLLVNGNVVHGAISFERLNVLIQEEISN